MSSKVKVYNLTLFKRLLRYIKSYRSVFFTSIISVFGLSIFGALRPVVLEKIVDENLTASNYDFFVEYIILMISLLLLEVISNYSFIFNAGLLGQSVVKDIRVKLFDHIQGFKMKYYDKSSDLEDIFYAHIGGADTFARALITADKIMTSSSYSDLRKKRYQSFDSGKGKDFESGKLELNDLYEIAKDANEISPESGKQELFENILNQYI